MAQDSSSPNSQTQSSNSSSPQIIKVPSGGGLDKYAFEKVVSPPVEDKEDDVGDEAEESSERDVKDNEESGDKEDEQELQDEKDTEEDEEDEKGLDLSVLNEIKASSKKSYSVKVGDKEFRLPDDAVITHKVDGKFVEIPLKKVLQTTAGEMTVEERLSKIANYENQLLEKEKTITSQHEEREKRWNGFIDTLEKAATSDKPEIALALLGERVGKPPGQVYRELWQRALQWVKSFEEKGKTQEEVDRYFASLDNQWYKKKLDERDLETKRAAENQKLFSLMEESRQAEGISKEEMVDSINSLLKEEAFTGRNTEDCVNMACERALQIKHLSMVHKAISSVDEGLNKDENLIRAILSATNVHDWSVEEIAGLVKEHCKDVLTEKLNQRAAVKGTPKKQDVSEKQEAKSKTKKVRSVHDLRREFGLA